MRVCVRGCAREILGLGSWSRVGIVPPLAVVAAEVGKAADREPRGPGAELQDQGLNLDADAAQAKRREPGAASDHKHQSAPKRGSVFFFEHGTFFWVFGLDKYGGYVAKKCVRMGWKQCRRCLTRSGCSKLRITSQNI